MSRSKSGFEDLRQTFEEVSDKTRFKNRIDLERYYLEVECREKMDTFLVPDMEEIRKMLLSNKFNLKAGVKDEFDHMINWQRVFESIWM